MEGGCAFIVFLNSGLVWCFLGFVGLFLFVVVGGFCVWFWVVCCCFLFCVFGVFVGLYFGFCFLFGLWFCLFWLWVVCWFSLLLLVVLGFCLGFFGFCLLGS